MADDFLDSFCDNQLLNELELKWVQDEQINKFQHQQKDYGLSVDTSAGHSSSVVIPSTWDSSWFVQSTPEIKNVSCSNLVISPDMFTVSQLEIIDELSNSSMAESPIKNSTDDVSTPLKCANIVPFLMPATPAYKISKHGSNAKLSSNLLKDNFTGSPIGQNVRRSQRLAIKLVTNETPKRPSQKLKKTVGNIAIQIESKQLTPMDNQISEKPGCKIVDEMTLANDAFILPTLQLGETNSTASELQLDSSIKETLHQTEIFSQQSFQNSYLTDSLSGSNNPLPTQEKLHLSAWGFPDAILQCYLEQGICAMFPWQVQCLSLPNVLNGKNLVYSAPTSAGKTLVAEILLLKRVLETGRKGIIILPFVSVAREKMFYLQKLCTGTGLRVEGFMGSHNPTGGFKMTDIGVCTIEKANNLINRLMEDGQLDLLSIVVVDELHLLGDSQRGYLLELMMTKLLYVSSKNSLMGCDNTKSIQLVGMSATLPNLDVIAQWLNAELYTTNFRPVPLYERLKIGNVIYNSDMSKFRDLNLSIDILDDSDQLISLCFETILEGFSVLLFCPTKIWCEKLAATIAKQIFDVGRHDSSHPARLSHGIRIALESSAISRVLDALRKCPVGLDAALAQCIAFGTAYHHAGLTLDERDIIEGAFRTCFIRILVATSTLSSGVNLPARRVIIRSPMFGGKPMDVLVYRQMIGRAGRKGVDSEGESILMCRETERQTAIRLLTAPLPPIRSCLQKDTSLTNSLKRAVMEVVIAGVVTSPVEIKRYFRCTLLAATLSEEDQQMLSSQISIAACIRFLEDNELIRLSDQNGNIRYASTQLGCAVLASGLSPDEGLNVFNELHRAQRCFVLENDLHILYQVTPTYMTDLWPETAWISFISLWENLSEDMKMVGTLVGVEENFLMRAVKGAINRKGQQEMHKLAIHQRFFTALALHDLVHEIPLNEVSARFSINRGVLQSLQQSAATFAGMVTVFCKKLGWYNLDVVISQFQTRLHFGVQRELCDLVRLSLLNGERARVLYLAGIQTVQDLAHCDHAMVEAIMKSATPFRSQKLCTSIGARTGFLWTNQIGQPINETEAAKLVVAEARILVQKDLGISIDWNKGVESVSSCKYSACDVPKESINILVPSFTEYIAPAVSNVCTIPAVYDVIPTTLKNSNLTNESSLVNEKRLTFNAEASMGQAAESKKFGLIGNVDQKENILSPISIISETNDSLSLRLSSLSETEDCDLFSDGELLKSNTERVAEPPQGIIDNTVYSQARVERKNLASISTAFYVENTFLVGINKSCIGSTSSEPQRTNISKHNLSDIVPVHGKYITADDDILAKARKKNSVTLFPRNFTQKNCEDFRQLVSNEKSEPAMDNIRNKCDTVTLGSLVIDVSANFKANSPTEKDTKSVILQTVNANKISDQNKKISTDGNCSAFGQPFPVKNEAQINCKFNKLSMERTFLDACSDQMECNFSNSTPKEKCKQKVKEKKMVEYLGVHRVVEQPILNKNISSNLENLISFDSGKPFVANNIGEELLHSSFLDEAFQSEMNFSAVDSNSLEMSVFESENHLDTDGHLVGSLSDSFGQLSFNTSKMDVSYVKTSTGNLSSNYDEGNQTFSISNVNEKEGEEPDHLKSYAGQVIVHNGVKIIDVANSEIVFKTFIQAWKEQHTFSMCVAYVKAETQVVKGGIGWAVMGRMPHRGSRKKSFAGLVVENSDNLIIGLALSWNHLEVYYLSLQNTTQDSSDNITIGTIHLEQRIETLKNIFSSGCFNKSVIRVWDAKTNLKNLALAGIGLLNGKFEDPKICIWMLNPDREQESFQAVVASHEPSLSHLLSSVDGEKTNFLGEFGEVMSRTEASLLSVIVGPVMSSLKESLNEQEMWNTFTDVEMPNVLLLTIMELNGFGFNSRQADILKAMMQTRLSSLEQNAFQLVGRPFSLSSSKQVSKILYTELALNGDDKQNKRIPNNIHVGGTSKEDLEKLVSCHPLPSVILEWRKINSALNKVLLPLQKHRIYNRHLCMDRIHPLTSTFCATGRISIQEPNLQMIPRDFDINFPVDVQSPAKSRQRALAHSGVMAQLMPTTFSKYEKRTLSIRDAFVSGRNCLLLAADYSQLELRILAHLSGDKKLKKLFSSSDDAFITIAAAIFHCQESSVTSEHRQQTKQVCYGIIYGMGCKTLAAQLKIEEKDADKLMNSFWQHFGRVKEFLSETVEWCKETGYVSTLMKRRRYLQDVGNEDIFISGHNERQAINTLVQGSAADIVKSAMVKMSEALSVTFTESLSFLTERRKDRQVNGGYLVLQLHDELIYEVVEEDIVQVAQLLKYHMEAQGRNLCVPLPVKLKVGPTWGSMQPFQL